MIVSLFGFLLLRTIFTIQGAPRVLPTLGHDVAAIRYPPLLALVSAEGTLLNIRINS
jgi:uncharacterized membrane protein